MFCVVFLAPTQLRHVRQRQQSIFPHYSRIQKLAHLVCTDSHLKATVIHFGKSQVVHLDLIPPSFFSLSQSLCSFCLLNTWKFVLVYLLNGLLWAGQNKLSTWIRFFALEMWLPSTFKALFLSTQSVANLKKITFQVKIYSQE